MSCVVEPLRSWPRAAALALIAFGLAACSADSSRLNENPFATRGDTTGTVPPAPAPAAPAGRVESRPLPQTTAQYASPHQPAAAPLGGGTGVAGGGRGMASYAPASVTSAPAHLSTPADVTGTVKPPPSTSWTAQGGMPHSVAQGETVELIARRYGVPQSAIVQTNNLSPSATLSAGQQIIIPRYIGTATASPPPASAPPATRPVASKAAPAGMSPAGNPGVHVVAQGETLSKISRLYGKPVTEIAKANNIQVTSKINVGDRLVIPGVRVSAAKPKATPTPAAETPAASSVKPAPVESTQKESKELIAVHTEAPKDTANADPTGALPKFRWPANGRVISPFGPAVNGQQNDGINIALPENTPVKAAEDGVVAYAGNELKGYGNLVLVRHPNGYVTAYAHAKELLVRRGDQVKRGQPIARSGQSGNVNAPQLHFEIRKGASPLDPMRFLNGA
ncbi:MAG: LysM peptidoglycan-binding domain-containing M23 family metallopeptidase [Hyphomicrobiales bacterium]|nr:LysM peptidoglycan-binding domain-containing M23 family metallopeptidase [Hyphomicrobiales bacterium]